MLRTSTSGHDNFVFFFNTQGIQYSHKAIFELLVSGIALMFKNFRFKQKLNNKFSWNPQKIPRIIYPKYCWIILKY